jgi:hypothetical protein
VKSKKEVKIRVFLPLVVTALNLNNQYTDRRVRRILYRSNSFLPIAEINPLKNINTIYNEKK